MVISTPDNELIAYLNVVLKYKLTGINQYFLHARMLKYMGNVKLADYEYKSSIDIMKHSDMLVEHILSIGGFPDLQELSKLNIGETASEMLQSDLLLSEATLVAINAAIEIAERKEKMATAGILRKILEAQQEHIDFIHNQISYLTTDKLKEKESA